MDYAKSSCGLCGVFFLATRVFGFAATGPAGALGEARQDDGTHDRMIGFP